MTDTIPHSWSQSRLFQEFNFAAHADAFFGIILQHKRTLEALKGAELVRYCEDNIKPHLPHDLITILDDMKAGKTNAALIRGFRFGKNGIAKAEKTPFAVVTMAALNALLGTEPMRNDKDEIRIDDIYPENKGGTKQIRSAQRLDYSNDAMAATHVPEFGAIACINGDPQATLDIHDVGLLKDTLSPEAVECLERRAFWFAEGSWMKDAVEKAGHMHNQPDHPSLRLIGSSYAVFENDTIRYSQDSAGTTPASQSALEEFVTAINNQQPLSLGIKKGDIILRNNRATIYGRSECQNFGLEEKVSLYIRQRAVAPCP